MAYCLGKGGTRRRYRGNYLNFLANVLMNKYIYIQYNIHMKEFVFYFCSLMITLRVKHMCSSYVTDPVFLLEDVYANLRAIKINTVIQFYRLRV